MWARGRRKIWARANATVQVRTLAELWPRGCGCNPAGVLKAAYWIFQCGFSNVDGEGVLVAFP